MKPEEHRETTVKHGSLRAWVAGWGRGPVQAHLQTESPPHPRLVFPRGLQMSRPPPVGDAAR
jgi:hypothetical protein